MADYLTPAEEREWIRRWKQEHVFNSRPSLEEELAEIKRNHAIVMSMPYNYLVDRLSNRRHKPVEMPIQKIKEFRNAREVEQNYRTIRHTIKGMEDDLIREAYKRKFLTKPFNLHDPSTWGDFGDTLGQKRQMLDLLKKSYGMLAKKGVPKAGLIARQGLTSIGRVSPMGMALTAADATKAFSDWEHAQEEKRREERGMHNNSRNSWQRELLWRLGLKY